MIAREAARRYGATDERATAGFATPCYTTEWDTTNQRTRCSEKPW